MLARLVPGTSPAAGSARACLDVESCAFAVGAPARVTVAAGEWRNARRLFACGGATAAAAAPPLAEKRSALSLTQNTTFFISFPGSSTAVLLCWLSPAPPGAPALLDARVTAAGSPLTAADLAPAAAAGCDLSCVVKPLSPRAPAATRVCLAGVSPDATAPGLAAALAGLPVEVGAGIAPGGVGVAWRVVEVEPSAGVCRVTRRTVIETE